MPPKDLIIAGGYFPYTENPALTPSIIFPNHGLQILSTILNLLGMSVVTWALARRTVSHQLFSLSTWRDMSWPRICVILVFINSWAFIFTTGVLISGTGLSLNSLTCLLGIYSCIALYASSKILIYAFLIEKVWIVWSQRSGVAPTGGIKSRWNSLIWRVCMLGLVPFCIILLLMVLGKIAEIRKHDGVCIIGLQKFASIPLLSFDLFITFFLTALFVHPLRTSSLISPKLRRVAARTLVSSAVALATSAVNIAVLTFLHGKELGWVCLTSCAADVTINAIVLFWVTTGSNSARAPHNQGVVEKEVGLPGTFQDDSKSNKSGRPAEYFGGRLPVFNPRPGDGEFFEEDELDFEKEAEDVSADGSIRGDQAHRNPHPFDYLPRQNALGISPTGPLTVNGTSHPVSAYAKYPPGPTQPLRHSPSVQSSTRRTLVSRPSFGQLNPGSSRASTAHSNNSHGSGGVVMIRAPASKPSSPSQYPTTLPLTKSTSNTLPNGVRGFLKGVGDVFGLGVPKQEFNPSLSVQVTITTDAQQENEMDTFPVADHKAQTTQTDNGHQGDYDLEDANATPRA